MHPRTPPKLASGPAELSPGLLTHAALVQLAQLSMQLEPQRSFSRWSSAADAELAAASLRRIRMRSGLRQWFSRTNIILGASSKSAARRAESHHFVRLVLPALRCWRLSAAWSSTSEQLSRAHRRTTATRRALRTLSKVCGAGARAAARSDAAHRCLARCTLRHLGRSAAARRRCSWVALRGVLAQRLFATRRWLRRWAVWHASAAAAGAPVEAGGVRRWRAALTRGADAFARQRRLAIALRLWRLRGLFARSALDHGFLPASPPPARHALAHPHASPKPSPDGRSPPSVYLPASPAWLPRRLSPRMAASVAVFGASVTPSSVDPRVVPPAVTPTAAAATMLRVTPARGDSDGDGGGDDGNSLAGRRWWRRRRLGAAVRRWCGALHACRGALAMQLSARSLCGAVWLRRWRVATSAAAYLAATARRHGQSGPNSQPLMPPPTAPEAHLLAQGGPLGPRGAPHRLDAAGEALCPKSPIPITYITRSGCGVRSPIASHASRASVPRCAAGTRAPPHAPRMCCGCGRTVKEGRRRSRRSRRGASGAWWWWAVVVGVDRAYLHIAGPLAAPARPRLRRPPPPTARGSQRRGARWRGISGAGCGGGAAAAGSGPARGQPAANSRWWSATTAAAAAPTACERRRRCARGAGRCGRRASWGWQPYTLSGAAAPQPSPHGECAHSSGAPPSTSTIPSPFACACFPFPTRPPLPPLLRAHPCHSRAASASPEQVRLSRGGACLGTGS